MQNKLQELTDKLYNEGLSKGKQEGEAILNEAKAAKILSDAGKEAEEMKSKVTGDLKMAAAQSISAARQEIENLLIGKVADKDIDAALSSADFVKQIITVVAKAFDPASSEPADLSVVLPESLKKEVEPFLRKELASALGSEIEVSFSKKISGGFTIGPKGEGWFVSFTDETFRELISAYLRPATKKILFGE